MGASASSTTAPGRDDTATPVAVNSNDEREDVLRRIPAFEEVIEEKTRQREEEIPPAQEEGRRSEERARLADDEARQSEERLEELCRKIAASEEAARQAERRIRLINIRHIESSNIPPLKPKPANEQLPWWSSSSEGRQLPDFTPCVPFDPSLQGFAQHPQEDEVCREVMASLLTIAASTVTVKHFTQAVTDAATKRGVPSLRPFYGEIKHKETKRVRLHCDFTLPNEQRPLLGNTCVWLDVEATKDDEDEGDGGDDAAKEWREMRLREGAARAVCYLAQRHEHLDDLPDSGIACVASGVIGLTIVRIDFRDDKIPVTFSSELPLLPSEGSDTVPEGLRALVRLMLCATDVAPFGLKPVEFVPAPPYRCVRLLGAGGFGTITEVAAEGSTKTMACKWIRNAEHNADLHWERSVLEDLASEPAAPFVPRVCGVTTDSKGEGEALLLSPVGVPFEDALFCRDSEDVPLGSDTRMQQAAEALGQLWAALSAAHAKGYVHCDVRPSNIVFVDADSAGEGPSACLIDWGLAKRLGQEYDSSKMMGELQFFSERQLLLLFSRADKWTPQAADDLEAAVLTFFTMVLTTSALGPWGQTVFYETDVIEDRAFWLTENADELRRAIGFIPEAASGARHIALSLIDASIKRDVK